MEEQVDENDVREGFLLRRWKRTLHEPLFEPLRQFWHGVGRYRLFAGGEPGISDFEDPNLALTLSQEWPERSGLI